MLILTVVSLVPVTFCVDDTFPYDPLFVPYSNHAYVSKLLALTVPSNFAELDDTLVAEPVVTFGNLVVSVTVLKDFSLP